MENKIKRKNEEDKWEKLASVGNKIEDADPLDIQQKTIDFGKRKPDLKDDIFDTLDTAKDTNQYLKLFNKSLAKRVEKIKKMTFDKPFSLHDIPAKTPSTKSFEELNSLPLEELSADETQQLMNYWLALHEVTKSKVDSISKTLEEATNQFNQQAEKIESLGKEFERKKSQEQDNTQNSNLVNKSAVIELIQKHISEDEKYDSKKLNDAIKAFKESLNASQ